MEFPMKRAPWLRLHAVLVFAFLYLPIAVLFRQPLWAIPGTKLRLLIRHQHPRKALWGPIQIRFKHLPGCRRARWAAECAVRLARCEWSPLLDAGRPWRFED